MIEFSIVIVSYYNIPMVVECIESIIKYNDIYNSLEIIVSDNSPDHSVAKYLKNNYKNIKCVENPINGGFGYGNNRGVELAQGKYILFLNPDTIFVEPILRFAIDKFENNPNLFLFGLKLVTREGEDNLSYMLLDCFSIFDHIFQNICWKRNHFIPRKMYTSGANIFIRKDVFDQLGGFDEKFFMYYEESDLLRRLLLKYPEAYNSYFMEHVIIHLEGGTTKNTNHENAEKAFEREIESLRYYCKKYSINFIRTLKKILLKNRMIMFFNCICGDKTKYNNRKLLYGFYKQFYLSNK